MFNFGIERVVLRTVFNVKTYIVNFQNGSWCEMDRLGDILRGEWILK